MLYELFSGGTPLFTVRRERTPMTYPNPNIRSCSVPTHPYAQVGPHDASHLEALSERTVHFPLGRVHPPSARHLLEKLLHFEPGARASLDEISKHAWLGGGLDTCELEGSFTGLQSAQARAPPRPGVSRHARNFSYGSHIHATAKHAVAKQETTQRQLGSLSAWLRSNAVDQASVVKHQQRYPHQRQHPIPQNL